jgi:hypothetical protein
METAVVVILVHYSGRPFEGGREGGEHGADEENSKRQYE